MMAGTRSRAHPAPATGASQPPGRQEGPRAGVEGSVHDRNRAGLVMVETEHMAEFVHHDGSQIHGLPAAAGRIAVDVDVVAEGQPQPVPRQVADLDIYAA